MPLVEVVTGQGSFPAEPRSLRIRDRVDERSTCDVELVDADDAAHFEEGQGVEVRVAGQRVFAGIVTRPRERPWGPIHGLEHQLTVGDWHYLAERRAIARAWEDQPAGDVVRDIVGLLAADGVTEGDIDDGPHVEQAVVNYRPASVALDRLAEQAQHWWRIDFDRRLHFRPYSAVEAPWHITPEPDGSLADVAAVTVERRNPEYRNRQVIRGGRDITAPQTEGFRGDGDTQSFTVGFPIAREPSISLGGVPQTVGVAGIDDDSGAQWFWSHGSRTITQDREGTPPGSGVLLEVTYQGYFDVVVVSHDQAAVLDRQQLEGVGSGIVDHVHEEPEVAGRVAAFELAGAKLLKYARRGRRVTYDTRRAGLEPGQLQTVTIPRHDLAAEMLIEQVETRVRGSRLAYSVTAIEGPVESSWRKFFGQIAAAPKVLVFRENISQDEVLIILEQFAGEWGWVADVDVTVYACTLFPAQFDPVTGGFQLC